MLRVKVWNTYWEHAVFQISGHLTLYGIINVLIGQLGVLLECSPQLGEASWCQDHIKPKAKSNYVQAKSSISITVWRQNRDWTGSAWLTSLPCNRTFFLHWLTKCYERAITQLLDINFKPIQYMLIFFLLVLIKFAAIQSWTSCSSDKIVQCFHQLLSVAFPVGIDSHSTVFHFYNVACYPMLSSSSSLPVLIHSLSNRIIWISEANFATKT